MKVGYARVSTKEQYLALQRDALEAADCERIFWEEVSSRKEDRPELVKALDYCREGDVLVVWKLDRLGRSVKELIEIVEGLRARGVGFSSRQESLDTTTAGGGIHISRLQRDGRTRKRDYPRTDDGRTEGGAGARP